MFVTLLEPYKNPPGCKKGPESTRVMAVPRPGYILDQGAPHRRPGHIRVSFKYKVLEPDSGGRFRKLKHICFLSRTGPRELPKSAGNGGPGPSQYRRTFQGHHWISKSGWWTGWAPLGCPGQIAYSQYKMPPKGPPRESNNRYVQILSKYCRI